MIKNTDEGVFTVGIGGAAGDGVREAGTTLGNFLSKLGYEVFISFTYPSLIKGGHNFARISFGKEKIWSDHSKLDVLVALNKETESLHKNELNKDAVVFSDGAAPKFSETTDSATPEKNAVVLPMSSSAAEIKAPTIARNSVALGALCYLLDLNFEVMQKILQNIFRGKSPEANIKLADIGFEFLKKAGFRHTKKIEPGAEKKELIDGNTAFGKGLLAAGLDFYVSYPMTPATPILHFLASQQKAGGLKVVQPESELSVINMALGMAYAGKRVAVGSATGGFALMQEAFSFAGMAELPIVIAVSQRQGPATGVPTYSSQTDLKFAIHSGHGEFPRIVTAPGDPEEAFLAGADALNLAWKYQTPVIVLMDKILSEHMSTSYLPAGKIKIEKGKIFSGTGEEYKRYEITADGISPLAFPGTAGAVIKTTSYEHDENGITADEAEPVKKMIDKRFAKTETLKNTLAEQETVKTFGDTKSQTAIIFWGSTKGPVLEAAKYLSKPVKLVQILWAEPFDAKKITEELTGAKKIINIECNHDGQMAALIREKTSILITENILKYDSRPFEPVELAEQINSLIADH